MQDPKLGKPLDQMGPAELRELDLTSPVCLTLRATEVLVLLEAIGLTLENDRQLGGRLSEAARMGIARLRKKLVESLPLDLVKEAETP